MVDTNGGDVERHFLELEKQLQEDGFAPDSQVMKTTSRLMKALRSDGFAFAESEEPETEETSEESEASVEAADKEAIMENADRLEESLKASRKPKIKSVLRAFRARDALDLSVVSAVFAEIDGWTTRVIVHNGNHYVVVTNGEPLTPDLVKKALGEYAQEARATSAA